MPWYAGMAAQSHLAGLIICGKASLGDAMIATIAYVGVSLTFKNRFWVARDGIGRRLTFIGIGLAITTLLEWLATSVLDRWQYGADMWVVPVVGIGLAPALQWVIVPTVQLLLLRHIWAYRRA